MLHNLESVNSRLLHGYAVGNGQHIGERLYLVVVYTVQHARSPLCLHTYYTHRGLERLNRKSHTAGQSATANGHKYDVDVGIFVQYFHTHGALSGNDLLVVEGVDKRHVLLLVQLHGFGVSIVVHARHQANFSAKFAGSFHL